MSEHSETTSDATSSFKPKSIDPMLVAMQHVVGMGKDNAIPLTLAVKGLLITGTLVSLETFVRVEEEYLNNVVRGGGRDFFLKLMELANEKITVGAHASVGLVRQAMSEDVLYLVRARVLAGARSVPRGGEEGVPWRVRLSEVDGWTFGESSAALVALDD